MAGKPTATVQQKRGTRRSREACPTGEKFDPRAAFEQAERLYPNVMARLAE